MPRGHEPSAATRRTSSGPNSSRGLVRELTDFPALNWGEVEADVQHIADFSAKFSQSQAGHQGVVTMTMQIPVEYLHAAMDAHLASNDGMVYIRVYKVPLETFRSAKVLRDQERALEMEDGGDEDEG